MARCLVYAFVLLQVAFLVCSEETDATTEASSSSQTTTPTTSVEPTRDPIKTSSKPPLVHNALDPTERVNNTNMPDMEKKKNGASSLHVYLQIVVVSCLGVVLSVSAI